MMERSKRQEPSASVEKFPWDHWQESSDCDSGRGFIRAHTPCWYFPEFRPTHHHETSPTQRVSNPPLFHGDPVTQKLFWGAGTGSSWGTPLPLRRNGLRGRWRRSHDFFLVALFWMSHVVCTSQDTCQPGQTVLHSPSTGTGLSLRLRHGEASPEVSEAAKKLMSSPPLVVMREAGGIDRDKIRQELFLSLQLSEEERLRICALEQGTEEWLNARKNRLTGSNFGAAVGHNKWKSPAALAHDMLYGTFQGNDATRWGNDHEDLACQEYCLARRSQLERENAQAEVMFVVTHSGLNPHPSMNWLAVSPDGHVKENGVDGLLEIKCPYSKRIYPEIPPYYMDQIQGGMGVLELPWADFCVWTPHSMQIQRVHFDRRYWEDHLKPGEPRDQPARLLRDSPALTSRVVLPGLEHFYHSVFLPAYIDREVRRRQGIMSVPPAPR